MIEFLKAKQDFRAEFAAINPDHPDLSLIDADIEKHRLTLALIEGQVSVLKRFTPEAYAGLKEVGHRFARVIEAKSLVQLIAEGVIPADCVNSSANLRSIVPVAREVAINPDQVVLPGSNNLSLDDQRGGVANYAQGLKRRNLKHGSLDTVDFNLTNASVYVQVDRAFEKQTGKPLYTPRRGEYGLWVRTIDETAPGRVAGVGRSASDPGLCVSGWFRDVGRGLVWAAPVAEPK